MGYDFDLVVIGSGPAGRKAAIQAAKLGKRVAVVKRIPADAVLYSAGRHGATGSLDLQRAGVTAGDRGRIAVGPTFRTAVKNVYAVGDMIGFPSLAATSMEQGRIAA